MENLSYLFAAFSFFWVILFYYVFRMNRKQKSLQDEIEQVRRILEEKSR